MVDARRKKRKWGERLLAALKPLNDLPHVREVRGVGFMLGIELDQPAAAVQAGARSQGVLVRASGTNIVISPPLVITEEQVDRLAEVLLEQVRNIG